MIDKLPEFDQTTMDRARGALERMMDNQDYGDELLDIAESDSHFPFISVDEETPEQEDANTEFVDALDALTLSRFAAKNISPIRDLLLEMRDYLECHNAPDALEGYMNDIAEEINPILIKLDIAPITIVPDRD